MACFLSQACVPPQCGHETSFGFSLAPSKRSSSTVIPVTLSFFVIGHLTRIRLITARICHETATSAREKLAEAAGLWQHGKNARWKSRPALRFGESREDNRTSFRHLIEMSQQLDLIVIVREHICLE